MGSYSLLTDMTCDLDAATLEMLHVKAIPMAFQLGGSEYNHYPDEREITLEEFYTRLKAGEDAKTSQIGPSVYQEYFETELKAGKDILYLCFTSGLSGTISTANVVAKQLLEDYPDRKINIVDTLCASVGEGILVYLAAEKYMAGMELDELTAWSEAAKTRINHWFTVEDLYHLKRGGRLSTMEALVGTALKIKPILSVDGEGKLVVMAKERGTKKALSYLIEKLKQNAVDTENGLAIIGHANAPELAETVAEMVKSTYPGMKTIISKIGPIIGAHVGSGMCALVFLGKE